MDFSPIQHLLWLATRTPPSCLLFLFNVLKVHWKKEGKKSVMRRRNQREKSGRWVLKKQKESKISRRTQHTKLDRK